MTHRILVVDDDPHIRDVICFALEKAGMIAAPARDGVEALARLEREGADLVILDVGMPEMDGLEACRRIRKLGETPILFLSARGDEIDRILGLELGGDDYVVKPFSPRELVARVTAILKRAAAPARAEGEHEDVMQRGALSLDAPRFQAAFAGRPVSLTAMEFAILRTIASRDGIVFSRERLMEAAYDNVHVSDRTIDSHVRNIRAKFIDAGCAAVIETVHGVGFRLGDVSAKIE